MVALRLTFSVTTDITRERLTPLSSCDIQYESRRVSPRVTFYGFSLTKQRRRFLATLDKRNKFKETIKNVLSTFYVDIDCKQNVR